MNCIVIYIIQNKYHFTETLRKYAVVPVLHRNCVKDYKITGTNKIIEKGVQIFIPAFPLQRDEQYYPEPEKFKPERFNEDNPAGKNLSNRPYLPFGEGNNSLHSYINNMNHIFIQYQMILFNNLTKMNISRSTKLHCNANG